MALHKRRVASVTSLRGWPYMPLKVMLCPRHEATASQPLTCWASSASLRSRRLAWITVRLSWFLMVSGRLSGDRTITLTCCPRFEQLLHQQSSGRTACAYHEESLLLLGSSLSVLLCVVLLERSQWSIVMTTLPFLLPWSKYRLASAISCSG